MRGAYYNEIDEGAAALIVEMMKRGVVAPGEVDTRSIVDVHEDDLIGFTQCHFFAGLGGWSYAARLAGWSDDRPLWTGSAPCQPFSVAGEGRGTADERHLWPHLLRLAVATRRKNRGGKYFALVGEQVAGKAGDDWLDGVRVDLESQAFAFRAVEVPACAVNAPHQRQRNYWVGLADADGGGGNGRADVAVGGAEGRATDLRHDGSGGRDQGVDLVDTSCFGRGEGRPEPIFRRWWPAAPGADAPISEGVAPAFGGMGDTLSQGSQGLANAERLEGDPAGRPDAQRTNRGDGRHDFYASADWILCHDGKARRVADARAPLLVDGFPNRILGWRAFGNAIHAILAAEVIASLIDVLPEWRA